MKKATLFASLLAASAIGIGVAVSSGKTEPVKAQDARIIVEVDRDVTTVSREGAENTQNIVMNNIRSLVGGNFKLIARYDALVNAIAISVNSDDIAKIKQVPGVKSVTLDEIHWEQQINNTTPVNEEGVVPIETPIAHAEPKSVGKDYGGTENASAKTMNKDKEKDYYDGEGTTIAILDNEFYFKGDTVDGTGTVTQAGWKHDAFSPLADSVAVKHKGLPDGYRLTRGFKAGGFNEFKGSEGSLYLNNKVPYYFDYGGEKAYYTDTYHEDYDVSSDMTYHGSHVATLCAGNDTVADYYGIAPKAQLICMKVFTNFRSSGMDNLLQLSSHTGAYDIPIMNALQDCIYLGVDGINMSLGSNLDDFDGDSITLRTLKSLATSNNATGAPILTAISAGNSGKTSYKNVGAYANWTTNMEETGILSSYANAAASMTVASANPDKMYYEHALKVTDKDGQPLETVAYEDQIVNREGYGKEYTTEYPLDGIIDPEHPTDPIPWVWVPGFGRAQDYVNVNVKNKVAVVFRGSNTFADKYAQAKAKQAKAIIIVNNDPTSNDFNFRFSFGDDFKPDRPCCLVLFKDKEYFSNNKEGFFTIESEKMYDNPNTGKLSTFTSDGATFDLDLKPEITAPGDYIRGAIPPQTTEDKEQREFSTYAFLSGTSMSSPNFAGAQSVVLSKKSGEIYEAAKAAGRNVTSAEKKQITDYRQTVNMRLMSTANPMLDDVVCPEDDPETAVRNLASPRRQGAGMANIDAAYNSPVYLEGMEANGVGTGKAKIALRNNPDINNGIVNLSFLAHNEGNATYTYNMKLNVLRPATIKSNAIVKGEYTYENEEGETVTVKYNDLGTFDNPADIPGFPYYEVTGAGESRRAVKAWGNQTITPKIGDVFKLDRDMDYAATPAQALETEPKATLKKDNWLVIDVQDVQEGGKTYKEITYMSMPGTDYQSTCEKLIAQVDCGQVTVAPGTSTINVPTFELTAAQKAEIAELYKYGCYIEGYVTLEKPSEGALANQYDLSMVYMGYYTNDGQNLNDVPVVEPFDFEQDDNEVYPSDLVNDLAKALVGKDKVDMGSMWVTGYVEPGDTIRTDDILTNDDNFANLTGFRKIGTNPTTGKPFENAADNLYAGAGYYSNTMVIQQFVLRSVKDNYFTITNKKTGEIVYKSVLEDMLFGDYMGTYPLYKSHVDDSYLSAGYMGHRAYAIVPLYNTDTGVAFQNGDYEVKFNYLMAANEQWVNKAYTLHIDSVAPEVESVNVSGSDVVIDIRETNLIQAQAGQGVVDFAKLNDNMYRITLPIEDVEALVDENYNYEFSEGRLFIKLTDIAAGEMGAIVKFAYTEDGHLILNNYKMAQSHLLTYAHDFLVENGKPVYYLYDTETFTNQEVRFDSFILFSDGPAYNTPTTIVLGGGGCGGSIEATSIILAIFSFSAIALVIIKKRKEKLGGNL